MAPQRGRTQRSGCDARSVLLGLAVLMLPMSLILSIGYLRSSAPVGVTAWRPVTLGGASGVADAKLVTRMDTLLSLAAPHPVPTFRTLVGTPEPRATLAPATSTPGARQLYVEVYSEAGCKPSGEVVVVDLDRKERRCEKPCIDFCTEKFLNHDVLQGAAKSIKVFGSGTVHMFSQCKGHWAYTDNGALGSVTASDGCTEVTGRLANLVHLELSVGAADVPPARKAPPPSDDLFAEDAGITDEIAKPVPFDYDAFQGDVHSYDDVLKRLKYWENRKREAVALPTLEPTSSYVTFYVDCGGFNNIRIAFEHAVLMAWMHKRTLVLPPAQPWYLLDFGPMKRDPPQGEEGKSSYQLFMDIDDMRRIIPVISTDDFLRREKDALGVPKEFMDAVPLQGKNEALNDWFDKHADFEKIPYSPIENAICFPDIKTYEESADLAGKGGILPRGALIDNRKLREYTPEMLRKRVLHYPSCKGDHHKTGYRYMGQTAAAVLWARYEDWQRFAYLAMRFVHYIPKVAEIAAKVVAQLGMFQYSALHIRRNDLQYPENFIPAEQSLANVKALLHAGEMLYIATDETEPNFFEPFEKAGHKVLKWQDFFTEKGGNVLKGMDIPRKNIGHIEQMICAGGRMYAGSRASTFSSYIFRLRGYVGTPDRSMYWHIRPYVGDKAKDWEHMPGGEGFVRGREYMNEMPYMWQLLTGEDGHQK